MGKNVTVDDDTYAELVKIKGELTQNQGKIVTLSETIKHLIDLKKGEKNADP